MKMANRLGYVLLLSVLVARAVGFQPASLSSRKSDTTTRSNPKWPSSTPDWTLYGAPSATADEIPSEEIPSTDRLSDFYTLTQYVFGGVGLVLFFLPDRTVTALLASKLGGSAGFGLASCVSWILRDANDDNRLDSDTYKRLSLGLLAFSVVGLSAVPGEAGFVTSHSAVRFIASIMTASKLLGSGVAFWGWKRGVQGSDGVLATKTALQDLGRGIKDTLKGLRVKHKKKALTYRNLLLLVVAGAFSSFMEGLFYLRYKADLATSVFQISLQWSALARLSLISTVIYSLKDAAERDRLSGSTFIKLNIAVGTWAAFVGLGQAVYPLGFAAYRGVELFAFSFPFFLKALKGQKEKMEQLEAKMS